MPVSLAAILVILVLAAEPAIAGIACNDRGCRVVRSDCQVISGYGGETEFDAIAVRTCNPPPAGPSKTRNQSPLGRFQHDHQQGRDYISAMPSRRSSKKDSPAKLAKRIKRRWRVVLLRITHVVPSAELRRGLLVWELSDGR